MTLPGATICNRCPDAAPLPDKKLLCMFATRLSHVHVRAGFTAIINGLNDLLRLDAGVGTHRRMGILQDRPGKCVQFLGVHIICIVW